MTDAGVRSGALELRAAPGRLEVRSRAVRRVVGRLVAEVDSVVERDAATGAGLIGRHGSPHVELVYEGPHVDVEVSCDVTWPCDLDGVAGAVRERVHTMTPVYAGVRLRTVDVTVRPVLAVTPQRRVS